MYQSNCNNGCNCGHESNCGRVGERILVNQSCGCGEKRNRCSCANTYRPGCGCQINRCNNNNSCGSGCGCNRPCPPRPRPCPCPKPRPCCEDRCRMQYRQCMRNCRMQEHEYDYEDYDDDKMNCGCKDE